MLSQGTKLFGGLSAATTVGLVIYGLSHNFTDIGAVSLWFLLGALVVFTGIAALTGDADVSAMDVAAVRSAANTTEPATPNAWPVVAAAGAALTAIGLVTDRRYFVAGLIAVAVAVFEWTVSAWADRASASTAFNGTVRRKMLNPVEFPIAAALGLGVLIFSFSRLMLAANGSDAPILFGLFGAVVLLGGTMLAAKPALRRGAVVGALAVASLGVAGAGVWAASSGQNKTLNQENTDAKEYAQAASDAQRTGSGDGAACATGTQVAKDENPEGAVAAKHSTYGTFVYNADGTLGLRQAGGTLEGQPLTVDRGNIVNILFRNDHAGEYRLRIYGGKQPVLDKTGNPTKDPAGKIVMQAIQYCTALIGEGKEQLLTFKLNLPSVYGSDPFYAEVPGASPAATYPIVVP
jgi:hypothetical protein